MTDIQASLGISQLKKINFFLKERNKIASIYNELLKDCPIILPNLSNKFYSSFHLYVILLKTKKGHFIKSYFQEVLKQMFIIYQFIGTNFIKI